MLPPRDPWRKAMTLGEERYFRWYRKHFSTEWAIRRLRRELRVFGFALRKSVQPLIDALREAR